jgi:pimeloyl-ACP methyl ester carboxylesterase
MRVNTGRCILDYEEMGEGKPFLMLHGFPLDREVMKGCMEPVLRDRKGCRRLYPDLPGMGLSPIPQPPWNSDMMLDSIIGFIEKVLPDQQLVVVGESYGCYLIRGLISRGVDIGGVCMICPLIVPEDERRDIPSEEDERGPFNQLSTEKERVSVFAQNMTDDVVERYRIEIEVPLSRADPGLTEALRSKGYPFSFDPDVETIPFHGPTLIMCGRQDRVVGHRDAYSILDNFPRATFSIIDGAGHYLQVEREQIFRSLVRDWIDRL